MIAVEERIDGSMHIMNKDQDLKYWPIATRPVKEILKPGLSIHKKKGWTPPPNHLLTKGPLRCDH
jgi:hypothetical protein